MEKNILGLIEEEQRMPIIAAMRCFNELPVFIVEAKGKDFPHRVAEPKVREGDYSAAVMEESRARQSTRLPENEAPAVTISSLPRATHEPHNNNI